MADFVAEVNSVGGNGQYRGVIKDDKGNIIYTYPTNFNSDIKTICDLCKEFFENVKYQSGSCIDIYVNNEIVVENMPKK